MKITDELKKAFEKMITSVSVELSEEGKELLSKDYTGRWFYIIDINFDGEITIQDRTHMQFSGLSLKYIKI